MTRHQHPKIILRADLLAVLGTVLTLATQPISIYAQGVDWELNGQNNPGNKFCGHSYDDAQSNCHLPPKQSLPCPNGESECPYSMPCWEVEEECTQPPTLAPTLRPTRSPITAKSDDPTDHYFCGFGPDQLYDWSVKSSLQPFYVRLFFISHCNYPQKCCPLSRRNSRR